MGLVVSTQLKTVQGIPIDIRVPLSMTPYDHGEILLHIVKKYRKTSRISLFHRTYSHEKEKVI